LAASNVKVKYVPTEDDLAKCRDLGKTVAKRTAEMAKE